MLITSYARVHESGARRGDAVSVGGTGLGELAIRVAPSAHPKCVRCWHHRADVGGSGEHPELCGRCVENVAGAGEQRRYA